MFSFWFPVCAFLLCEFVGSPLMVGIISFERLTGDPMKRNITDMVSGRRAPSHNYNYTLIKLLSDHIVLLGWTFVNQLVCVSNPILVYDNRCDSLDCWICLVAELYYSDSLSLECWRS